MRGPMIVLFQSECLVMATFLFKPAWYDVKEAQDWLEYSIINDRMYFFCVPFV